MPAKIPHNKRLTTSWYRPDDCTAAVNGERIPLALGDRVTQLCVIRGIRYHSKFAEDFLSEFPEAGDVFVRAANARRIMSNVIPDMATAEHTPYCIWYPEVASADTYRTLVERYPQLAYQVGRACAVAGYTELYKELEILPDVHIAEEARDNSHFELFDHIMSFPVRYSIMDDYNRSVAPESRVPSHLNADTAVRSYLEIKHKHGTPRKLTAWSFYDDLHAYRDHRFDITEDLSVDTYDSPKPSQESVVRLLFTPLPTELPAIPDKNLLILMAAHSGNIDRYARLRQPKMISKELCCVIRGIYHNVMFAKWWSSQEHLEKYPAHERIRKAINARFIMSNMLAGIDASTPLPEVPYCIWYPAVPQRATLKELARRRPDMKQQIARACIVADYQSLYNELDVDPDEALVFEAKGSVNPHYSEDLAGKVASGRTGEAIGGGYEGWKKYNRTKYFEPSASMLTSKIDTKDLGNDFEWIYDGQQADASSIELHVCALGMMHGDYVRILEERGVVDLDMEYEKGAGA